MDFQWSFTKTKNHKLLFFFTRWVLEKFSFTLLAYLKYVLSTSQGIHDASQFWCVKFWQSVWRLFHSLTQRTEVFYQWTRRVQRTQRMYYIVVIKNECHCGANCLPRGLQPGRRLSSIRHGGICCGRVKPTRSSPKSHSASRSTEVDNPGVFTRRHGCVKQDIRRENIVQRWSEWFFCHL